MNAAKAKRRNPGRISVDFAAGVCVCLAAVGVFAVSIGYIVRTVRGGAAYYQSAGFFPAIVSSLMFICGTRLLFGRGSQPTPARPVDGAVIFVLGWLAVYIFALLEWLPYFYATWAFLFVFMAAFRLKERREFTRKDAGFMAWALLLSALMSAGLAGLFGGVARIPLP
ncbi:MAG: tripartite tricarboxylate transporter TctB family protein [Synergistaceae bacterium]|jgi:hypothetical protein|nr:tripartite tricarboxylate transporter TctB family protein [Synergistaceae bacterium]